MGPLAGRRARALLGAVLVVGALAGAVLASASPASAAGTPVTLYVSSSGTKTTGCTTPATSCATIQEAVTAAEAGGYASDEVTVTVAEGTYATQTVVIAAKTLESLVVEGAGASTTTWTGAGDARAFSVVSGTVTIEDLSIDHGQATDGGGVTNAATLHLVDDTFSNDGSTADGGAVYSSGTVDFTGDTLSGDTASNGGGFFVIGGLNVARTTVSDDTATTDGGGGFEDGLVTDVDPDNTYSDDHAKNGGGFYITGADSGASDDTFFGDTATTYGGGAYVNTTGTATLTDDTFLGNTARADGGGFYNDGTMTVNATIIDGSPCGYAEAHVPTGSYDVWTTTGGCTSFTSSVTTTKTAIDLTTTLEPNTSTGAETLALLPASPAIDEVPSAACTIATDERGEPRPGDTTPTHHQTSCDAGAYEWQHSFVVLAQGAPRTGRVAHGVLATFQLAVTNKPSTSGALDFLATAGTVPSGVSVSSSGEITVSGTTESGTYTLDGTDSDSLHNSGTWTFRLTVGGTPFTITVNGQSATGSAVYGSTITFAETGLPSGATGRITFKATGTTVCTATLPTKTCAVDLTLATRTAPYVTSGAFTSGATARYPSGTSTNAVDLTVVHAQAEVTCTAGKTCTATATDAAEPGTKATITALPGEKTVVSVNFGTTRYPLFGCTGTRGKYLPYVVNWTSDDRSTVLTYTEAGAYKTARRFFSFFTFCYGSFLDFRTANGRLARFDSGNQEYEGTLPLCLATLGRGPCILLELKSGTSQVYYVESGPGGAPKASPSG